MSEPPSGTITFLFTDIEDSTRLWQDHPDAMQAAHARHGEIIVTGIEQHRGKLIRERGEGDSYFTVFSQATDAIAGITAIQLALVAEDWPAQAAIRVRAALHTGEALLREGDYSSSAVNRCARLRAIAHGGQTLLSRSTYELVRDALPEGVSLKDLGLHRLKDLQRPEQVFQIVHPDLCSDFPPLRSLDALATNLPQQLTRLVGREREVAAVRRLLAESRLLTLIGTGGVGKTRLALQAAAELLDEFPDGVWLVELAEVADPTLVCQEAAARLGVREEPNRPLVETLVAALRAKHLLVILDNCEHLVEASAMLVHSLLQRCPNVRLLTTSREALDVPGEVRFRVPSLSTPPAEDTICATNVNQYEATRLFVERVRESRPNFAVTAATAATIARICHRLDGIPLAIELAAARIRALTVEQLEARLEDRFRLLGGGSRVLLPRHQTLRAALDWSYDLLSEPERLLLRNLSVFSGDFNLDAAVAVSGSDEEVVLLDLLTRLADKSLLIYEEAGEEGRYHLLETVRRYGWERLQERGEEAPARDRHLKFFLAIAEEAEPHLSGAHQAVWLARLEREHDNLRSAIAWAVQVRSVGQGLRLVAALPEFWRVRGYLWEGRQHLARVLALSSAEVPSDSESAERAKALYAAGVLAFDQSDWAAANSSLNECLAIYRATNDLRGIAACLGTLGGVAWTLRHLTEAQELYEESLALFRNLREDRGIARLLNNIGLVAYHLGDYARARSLYEEALTLRQRIGHKGGIANSLGNLASLALSEGDLATARTLQEESLGLFRAINDEPGIAYSLTYLGDIAASQQDYSAARFSYEQGLAAFEKLGRTVDAAWTHKQLGDVARLVGDSSAAGSHYTQSLRLYAQCEHGPGTADSLDGFAALALLEGNPDQAARLAGAAEAIRADTYGSASPAEPSCEPSVTSTLRHALRGHETAWSEGRAMTRHQAAALATRAEHD